VTTPSFPSLADASILACRGNSQPSISWPVEAWLETFPLYGDLFAMLPAHLNRDVIRGCCAAQPQNSDGAVRAFLASLAWGYGKLGYGPHRASRVLSNPGAAEKLARARAAVLNEGPISGYRALAGPERLDGLGPAFGTKFLYFQNRDALILDRLIGGWYRTLSGVNPTVTRWDPARYAGYLAQMQLWAQKGRTKPDLLEEAVFTLIATTDDQSQWKASGL
jgi:hypothetical protein